MPRVCARRNLREVTMRFPKFPGVLALRMRALFFGSFGFLRDRHPNISDRLPKKLR